MLSSFRALVIALSCACIAALTPLSAAGDDNDCALYLSGPGRTSAYDYSLNLLRGNFGYEGQHTCITYDAVNQAYLEARKRILVSQPKGDWKPEDYASVGELILDVSINLARTYGLTYEEIEKGLPLIDTSRTLIREVCPPVFSHVECRAGKYRRFDGLCNNLQHPTWGSTMAPFQRLIGPLFSDGINAPRISHTGHDLPLSRVVSRTMHPDDGFHDHAGTVMVIAWGQFMDHDYTLTATPLDPINRNDPEECCKRPPHLKHPYCNEIRIPDDDYFYRLFGVKCIDFVRGFPSPRPGCRLGSRIPYNILTGAIDGNTVYGVTEKFARKLRTGYGGLLRMNSVFKEYGLKDVLPLKLDIPDEGCTRPNKNMYCFEAGEIRVNEQLVLTVMHTLMAREHNRVAEGLAAVNPHWDDETLFQEARRINIAEIQHITYNEFLPILLGKDVMEKFGLVLEKEGYWDGYDPTVNPDVIASFAAAAYRFGHSLLPTAVERWSKAHKFIASKRLSDLIRRPYDLYRAGVLDEYVMGLMNQVAQAMDDSITQEVTNHLFKKVGARFGMDLVSFNMQRGREFGLPGYMEFRKFCGLSGADTFQDLFGSMPNETVRKYETIFEHPIDVDLWSGGVSERPLPGSMLGPTFACIIATQFSYSRRGDRFWFELPNQPSSFTPEQLAEVRKARLARVICDNTDIIDTVQLYPMVLPDHELNPRVPCRSGIIPSMDFTKWAEPAPFAGAAKQFLTDAIIPVKNETEPCEGQVETSKQTISDIKCEDHNATADGNQECRCNDTTNTSRNSQNSETDSQKRTDDNDSMNILQNNNDTQLKECAENIKIAPHNCLESLNSLNEITDNDTVLKYVYKKNEKTKQPQKSKGHPKNSLKRRKRSPNPQRYGEPNRNSKTSPLIVDYATSHLSRDRENSLPLQERNKENIIKGSNLADFNIETLHDATPNTNSENNSKNGYYRSKHQPRRRNEESNQREEYRNNGKFYKKSEHNREKDYIDNRRNNRHNQESRESDEDNYSRKNKENDYESRENDEQSNYRTNKKDSRESEENYDQRKDNRSAYGKSRGSSEESDEKEKTNRREQSNEDKSYLREPRENSNESNEEIVNRRSQEKLSENLNSTSPQAIQDVDLDDFSYERIQVNKKGEVEPIVDTHENYEKDSSIEVVPLNSKKHETNDEHQSISTENGSASISQETSEDNKAPIRINDGEVKPVVELNNENSSELSEESNEARESQKANLNSEDQSLETLLGVKDTESNEENDKVVDQKNESGKGDVKQQFERIPLNYNHDKKEEKENENDSNKQTLENTSTSSKGDIPSNDGTVDTLSPDNQRFDENLNLKFDDVTVKLPEIKLPEDVLAYAYEAPSYEKDKEKQRFYNYNDEDNEEGPDEQKKNKNSEKQRFYHYSDEEDEEKPREQKRNDDDDDNYRPYAYYGNEEKQNYKEKNNDDEEDEGEQNEEDIDLYEKFVQERFGKRDSFEERSAKLQDNKVIPENPQLFETLQKLLKKTEETHKEADKSGDPNAAYMWTLEYGEQL